MARHNHGHSHGQGGQGGRREFSHRDSRHTPRPPRGPQKPPRIEEEFFDDEPELGDMEASETEIATYLTIRAQNIELLGLAAKISGCADPKTLLNEVDTESTLRRLQEIYSHLEEWVDPDVADEEAE